MALSEGSATIAVDLTLYYCEEETRNMCLFEDVRVEMPLTVAVGADSGPIENRYRIVARM